MVNRVAASLALPDTEACLASLRGLEGRVGLAEVRLDLMDEFDLPRLVSAAPCPLVITCRPAREGGRFDGPEAERLGILARAMELGCAYVDVEWDSVAGLVQPRHTRTRVIVSRHWTERMPESLFAEYEELRGRADVVKLVGMARRASDTLPVFELLRRARAPVIAIAMGEAGRLTRLLAPCFASCLLTYGAPAPEFVNAPGQLTVAEMADIYHLPEVGPHTSVHLHLCGDEESARAVVEKNGGATPGDVLHLPLRVEPGEAGQVVAGLRAYLPRLTLTAEPALRQALGEAAA